MAERTEDKDGLVAAIELLTSEFQDVKKLLILQALAMGCQQKHVAATLEVSDATLSRMFPKGFAKEMAAVTDRLRADRRQDG